MIVKVKGGASMTEETSRGDIESTKEKEWTAADFSQLPEHAQLEKNWTWFQNQKIGVLLHWGLYAQAGIVESWELSDADCWARQPKAWRPNMTQLKQDYWGLAQQFAPTHYDPAAWAAVFKNAGIRYAIFTTKHHDGFNMYHTQYSDYHADADLFGAFAQAMTQAGIGVGAYYSKADWHHPDYWRPDGTPKNRGIDFDRHQDPERWQRYVTFVHHQLTELAANYGPLRMLWLDAGWVGDAREPLALDQIIPALWQKQPQMLAVDRTMGGRFEQYVTPERQVPDIQNRPVLPWESNIPLANNWGYTPGDTYKSIGEIIRTILQVVTLGGNIVLGVGPKPDGTLPAPASRLLHQLGGWLALNGQGIYNTRPVAAAAIAAARRQGYAITQDDRAYYLFPLASVPPQTLDLHALHLPDTQPIVTRLGWQGQPFPVKAQHVVRLPGSLRQSLHPGLRIAKV
jgi:alpha-L-fucosidase